MIIVKNKETTDYIFNCEKYKIITGMNIEKEQFKISSHESKEAVIYTKESTIKAIFMQRNISYNLRHSNDAPGGEGQLKFSTVRGCPIFREPFLW